MNDTMSHGSGKTKVHVGCGKHLLEGWINCDIKGEVDMIWDLNAPPPFDVNTVDYLFTEHVLEHFTLDEGIKILTKFRKILKPGARIRVTVPDLRSCIESYESGFGFNFRNNQQSHLKPLRVNAEYLNKCFREHGHKFLYDENALRYSLEKVGFVRIQRFEPGQSDDENLKKLERRIHGQNSSQTSLCLEATKNRPAKPRLS